MTPADHDPVTASGIARPHRPADPLAAARTEQVRTSHAPATHRVHAADWAAFRPWCAERAATDPFLISLPASNGTLSLYVGHLDAKRSTTVRRALSTIRFVHARAGVAMPDEAYLATLAAVRGHAHRHAGAPPRQTRAAVDVLVQRLARACDLATTFGARDRALLLVSFDGAFRRSEFVGIDVEHLTRTGDGVQVRLGTSKSDQGGRGAMVTMLARHGSPWCPVAALEHWLDVGARYERPRLRRPARCEPRASPVPREAVGPGGDADRQDGRGRRRTRGQVRNAQSAPGARDERDRGGRVACPGHAPCPSPEPVDHARVRRVRRGARRPPARGPSRA